LKANHTDKQWRELTIERGSFVTSLQHLANENKLTVDQVRRVLNCLEKTGEITIKTTNKFTIISVSNYNTYQIAKTVKHQTPVIFER
jgi:DNA-binding transcriptional regulator YhcF (GntR family)